MNQKDAQRHPLFNVIRPAILTPPIEQLANFAINAYRGGRHGCRVIGRTRFGKTYAVTYLKNNLQWRTEPMAFLDMRFLSPKSFTEGYFFSMLSIAFGILELHRSHSSHAVARVANHLNMIADSQGAKLVVISMDEAQRMSNADWNHIVTLDNEMDALGKRLFFIFVHQLDTTGREAQSIHDNVPPQVLERYTKARFDFPGVTGPLDIRAFLDEYDEVMIWPPGSGISYTAHFAPTAFARGWRLADHAQQIYDVATKLRAETSECAEQWQWPMVSLEATIRYLLVSVAGSNPDFDGFTDDSIRQALIAAFFVD